LAENGDETAQFNLGLCYSTQTTNFVVGVKDDVESLKWFIKAAEQGFQNAQVEAGRAYYSGRGVNADKNKAVNWFRKAAEQGNVQGELLLGLCCKYGEGVPINADDTLKWLNQAARQNDATAQFELGCCYSEYCGMDGVTKSNILAYKWLSLAKAQGKQGPINGMDALRYVSFYMSSEQQRQAQILTAEYISENANAYAGKGIPAPISAANQLQKDRELAQSGDFKAALRLGLCYKYGEGVPINADEAVRWLTVAARHNDAAAEFELGCCYSEYGGMDGVTHSNITAYMWLSLAKAQGKQGVINGMDALQYVSFYLSSEQKSIAQKLAAEFVAKESLQK